MVRSQFQSGVRGLLLLVPIMACVGGTTGGGSDGGLVSGLGYEDIGTVCRCHLVPDPNTGGYMCHTNPTNTCARAGTTCVMATPDAFTNAGNPIWESSMFTRLVNEADGGITLEGECTLTENAFSLLACPAGTVAVLLSSGLQACKKRCLVDAECGRPGWICDDPLLDRRGLDNFNPPQEIPLDLKLCKPACASDFPDCLRPTTCTMGRPGCMRSAFTRGAPADLGIYVGDRNGGQSCNVNTGHCEPTPARGTSVGVGSPCTSNLGCSVDNLCVSDLAYADNPDGVGFCTYANCNPFVQLNEEDGCGGATLNNGVRCERAFEMGMCFLECRQGTLCSGGQKCGVPDMGRVANFDPVSGSALQWRTTHCIDCDLTGVCP